MSFINGKEIVDTLKNGINPTDKEIDSILDKSYNRERLSYLDVAKLLNAHSESQIERIYEIAGKIKEEIYGKRIVVFAPLYVTDHCVNNCKYCGYRRDNKFVRRRLTQDEIKEDIKVLENMGHKRIAFEAGEDPVNVPIEYVLESIKTIYKHSDIRRINVNIAATTVENFKKLKDAEIGTYILFQETYNKESYLVQHPKSIKGNYDYHLTAFDRAMEAGIDDVGGGVLFGLSDWKYEILGLMMHNDHLEEKYNVGFHTISIPRLKKAEGVSLDEYPNILTDEQFKRAVTIIRLAVPFTGIILSTRETKEIRKELLKYGVSQISAGSNTTLGGYKDEDNLAKQGIQKDTTSQFEVSDERNVNEIMNWLVEDKYIPSFCTACYRSGRTGDRFMSLAKSGQIGNVCEPNALMTLTEYLMDYADPALKEKGLKYVKEHAKTIRNQKMKDKLEENIEKIVKGERDLFV